MAMIGEAQFKVTVDSSRILAVLQAVEMYEHLLHGYGHVWTHEETATRANAMRALEQRNLTVEPS